VENISTTKLSYRNATLEDLPGIVAIYNSTIPSRMVTADTEPVTVESKITWFDEHSPATRPLWAFENEDRELIGWVSFQSFYGRPAYNSTAEISIYIKEKWRGKRLGKQVLSYTLSRCNDLNISTLLGYIFAHNTSSLNLFHGFGFSDWGYLPKVAILDGIERDVIIVGKRVMP
jgi:phosphinothricin acetyltransferase